MVRIQLATGYLDVKEGTSFPLTFQVGDIRDISQRKGNFSKTITLVGSKNNNDLLNHYYDVNIQAGTFDINAVTTCSVIQDGIPVNNAAVKDKADSLLLLVEKSDYLDRFHGKDGFAHYATLAGRQNVLPENIKLSDENTFNTSGNSSSISSADISEYSYTESKPSMYIPAKHIPGSL